MDVSCESGEELAAARTRVVEIEVDHNTCRWDLERVKS